MAEERSGMNLLKRVKVSGFKSIREMDLELGPLNVLIGANGAGKSNLLSFLSMMGFMMNEDLRRFVGLEGGASSILHYGPKTTNALAARLEFTGAGSDVTYSFELEYAAKQLLFRDEAVSGPGEKALGSLGRGHENTALAAQGRGNEAAELLAKTMKQWRVYHFHDTSETAKMRQHGYIHDNHSLNHDAGNLAAYLYMLRETRQAYYQRIVSTIRMVAPFFWEFVLEPAELNPHNILLEWRERDRDDLFGSHQLSDGTLRMMALVTLLLQPEDKLPSLIIIDEPELGLHPYAIEVIVALLESVSTQTQVIVATQSVSLVDRVDPEDVVVVARQDGASVFSRLDVSKLEEWLEEYSLGELWEKNVIGGRPSR